MSLLRRYGGLLALLLAACAGPAPVPDAGPLPVTSVAAARAFELAARFSLRLEAQPGREARQFVGRLEWRHDGAGDRLFFTDPLGQGVAELLRPVRGPVLLRLADGSERLADGPEALLDEALGAPLPLDRLAGWVQAVPGSDGRAERDAEGRLRRLAEAGWVLDYRYGEGVRPVRLDANLDGVLQLRLSVDTWNVLP